MNRTTKQKNMKHECTILLMALALSGPALTLTAQDADGPPPGDRPPRHDRGPGGPRRDQQGGNEGPGFRAPRGDQQGGNEGPGFRAPRGDQQGGNEGPGFRPPRGDQTGPNDGQRPPRPQRPPGDQ